MNGRKFYIHTIEKKQSLYSISKLYEVNLDTIYKLNPELKEGAKAGQHIRVPFPVTPIATAAATATAAPAPIDTNRYQTHKVAKQETIYSISRRYNLTEQQLTQLNPFLTQGLKEGQILIVGEKNKKKPKEKEKNVTVAPPTATALIPALPMDSALSNHPSKPKKSAYNISLLLPFKLDQVDTRDVPALAHSDADFPILPALTTDFFLGIKRAVDSLSAPDFSLTMQLYDIDEGDSTNLVKLGNDPGFIASDLVIGPFYASGFKAIGQRVNDLHTPVVSPFTPQNKILYNNSYISKTNPSKYSLLESLADYCIDSLSLQKTNFILMTVSSKDRKESDYTGAFKGYFNARMQKLGKPVTDTIRTANGIEGLKVAYKNGMRNVVIALSSNQVFIADFTTQLALFAKEKDIILCGWENITGYDNIDQEYLSQLRYTFPSENDLSEKSSHALDRWYRHQQQTSPSEYYYTGFDIGNYYLKNLKEQGPDFVHKLDQLPMEGYYLRFKFTRPDATTGFDNRGAYIFRYAGYQLQKTGWK